MQRNPKCEKVEIKQIIEAANLESPFTNIEFFIQEKFKIAGKSAGSGNTTNIGYISHGLINKINIIKDAKDILKNDFQLKSNNLDCL